LTRCYDSRVKVARLILIFMAVSYFAAADEAGFETVEEVLAVVGNTPILYSDVELMALLRVVDPDPEESPETYRSRLLEARIRLEVEFRDLEESGLLYRLEVDPTAVRGRLIARGGGVEVVVPQLESEGLSLADLDELALRLAAVDAYVQQRLRSRVAVTMEEIEGAYQQLLVDEIAATDEALPPLAAVRDRLTTLLVERKLNQEIERWLELAVTRQEVTRFSR
jgi:hypothetical protein